MNLGRGMGECFQSLHLVSDCIMVQLMQGSWQKSSSGPRGKEEDDNDNVTAVLSTVVSNLVRLSTPANRTLVHLKVSENPNHSFFVYLNWSLFFSAWTPICNSQMLTQRRVSKMLPWNPTEGFYGSRLGDCVLRNMRESQAVTNVN